MDTKPEFGRVGGLAEFDTSSAASHPTGGEWGLARSWIRERR